MNDSQADDNDLDKALALLREGELVGIPTETVYGLAADAANPAAVAQIFALKGRPNDHPVIVHIAGSAQLADWAVDIPAAAYALAEAFWPGPLTLILKRKPGVSDAVTGGQDTVGLRAPAHPLTQKLLQRFGGGLAAPSANQFGHVSPTTAAHVRAEFGDALPLVLDGGPCQIGVESTIVGLTSDQPTLLRPGGVAAVDIEAILGKPLIHHQNTATAQVRVSGLLDSHYAPRTPLLTGSYPALCQALSEYDAQRTALILIGDHNDVPTAGLIRSMPDDADDYAQRLYATLRELDDGHFDTLLLELPPADATWLAVNDRLRRAATARL